MWVGTEIPRVTDGHRVAFAAFHCGGDRFGAQSGPNDVLDVRDHQPIACELIPVRDNLEVVAPDHAFGVGARRTVNRLQGPLDLARDFLHLGEVATDDLHPHRGADAGGEHVDARLDRHGPSIGDAGELQRPVHLLNQAIDRQSGAPLLLGL